MKRIIVRSGAAFSISVVLAVLFLTISACLPQSPIDEHIVESAYQLEAEGNYALVASHSDASVLDNFTDSIILTESAAMQISTPGSILTNPIYGYGVEGLSRYAFEDGAEPIGVYPRYWMGFRGTIRLLLSFLDYFQIKRYVAVLFFTLFSAVMCSIAQNTDTKTAFLFALSMIFVRPHIIALSLQYSCCFLIAFISMLLVPWVSRHPKYESIFFLEVGLITMYFDFYTTPIITLGLPLVYLYLLRHKMDGKLSGKRILIDVTHWLCAYGGMWLTKLVLVTVFTDVNGIANGLKSFSNCVGLVDNPSYQSYSLGKALNQVVKVLCSDEVGGKILVLVLAAAIVVLPVALMRKHVRWSNCMTHISLLAVAALPIAWFVVAGRPLINHAYFQYRSITVTFFAAAAFLRLMFTDADLNRSQGTSFPKQ